MVVFLLCGLGACWGGGARGQAFEQQVAPFPVRDTSGRAYTMPFLGGFNTPRPQLVDIDGDGDRDLFVQERRGRLAYFEHTQADSAEAAYAWRTDQYRGLDVGAWARFGDLDGDGDPDLLAEEPISTVRYYRNEGTATAPAFSEPIGPLTRADGDVLFAERQNVPALVPLDCEGLPDLLLGGLDGRLRYLEHTGTSADGVPVFSKRSDAYQDVCVGPPSVCGSGTAPLRGTGSSRRHGANALAVGDLGGDGDPDLLWGDFFSQSLYLLENTGSCDAPQIERVADVYPPDDPVQTSGYNASALADLDGDGDQDLLVGVLGGGSGTSSVENLLFLENTGTDARPAYVRRTRRFLYTVDVGAVSAPAFVDLDGDGDRDLVVGNNAEPGGASARLHVFENVGSPSSPSFEQRSTRLLPDAEDGFNFVPAFGDVDGDADPDLFLGTFSGTVRFYRNTGGPESPRFEREPEHDVELPGGNYATPTLVDIDGDDDRDLFVGSSSSEGVLAFFRNDGSVQAPDFRLADEEYGGIRVDERRTHPAFADVDGDGAPDLFLGGETGVSFYRNAGTSDQPSFQTVSDSVRLPLRSLTAPALADLNGDRRPDLVAGGDGGGLKFFAGRGEPIGPSVPPEAGVQALPNPFRRVTRLAFSLRTAARVQLTVYDLLGRRVATLADRRLGPTDHAYSFGGEGRASGVYLYVLRVGGQVRDRGRIVRVR